MAAAVTDPGAPPADRRRTAVPALLVVGTTLSAGAAVWATSYPGTTWRYYGLAFVLTVATAGLWLVSLVVRLGNRRRPSALHVAVPLVFVLLAAAVAAGLPMEARWAASQDDFRQTLAQLADGAKPRSLTGRIGWYQVSAIKRVGSRGYAFHEGHGSALVDLAGFAYLPDGPDHFEVELAEVQVLEPIGDGWYRFVASW